MMNKNKKWMVAIGVLTTMTVSGLALAANKAEKTDASPGKRGAQERGFKHHKGQRPDNQELLTLLQLDQEAFHNEMRSGKTLAELAKERGVSERQLKDVMIKQMTQRIDAGVKAGKLTAEQADKMKADMDQRVNDRINRKGPMLGHMQHRRHQMDHAELFALLKLDQKTFHNEMRSGKTLAELAKERGVSEQQLKDVMIKQMTQRIDAGVKAGKLTAEKADKMKVDMDQRVSDRIHRNAPLKGHMQHRRHHIDNSELLALLKMDQETFRNEMKSGRTLAEIAKERGVSEQQLKDVMMKQMIQRLDADVKAGKLSAEKAAEIRSKVETHIADMIAGKRPTPRR